MLVKFARLGAKSKAALAVAVAFVGLLAAGIPVLAGGGGNNGFFGNQNQVGGISITAEGVVGQPSVEMAKPFVELRQKLVQKAPAPMQAGVEIRKISLKKLHAAMEDAIKNKAGVLPQEIKYMAGIQRIEYVLIYPEENDVVLAGPGEGWKVDAKGNVVGLTTGRPVIQLDDFLTAFRSVENARTGGITCSIDPTPEGRKAFEAYMSKQTKFGPNVAEGIEKAMGAQVITLTGVPETSHVARVLVAADYKMKRIAMGLEPSPIKELPSYISMLKSAPASATPRWWLACNYEPLAKSADGLAWQIRGTGVKAMTEDDVVAADGSVKGSGKKNAVAQQWSDKMTKNYDELSKKEIVFGDLRNVMDMCVVAALIQKEGLLTKANLSIPLITNSDSMLTIDSWYAPKKVATQCSFVKKGTNWIITASGGVEITSWQVASQSKESETLPATRTKATAAKDSQWWWN